MLYSEIIAVCSQIHTKHINALCGQNVEFLYVEPGGTVSNHWALKSSDVILSIQSVVLLKSMSNGIQRFSEQTQQLSEG
jgi:hypothetical protein